MDYSVFFPSVVTFLFKLQYGLSSNCICYINIIYFYIFTNFFSQKWNIYVNVVIYIV